MTTSIYTNTFRLAAGEVVEIPDTIGRKAVEYGGSSYNGPSTQGVVIGSGELREFVLLSTSTGAAAVPDSAEIIGVDVAAETVWYAIPRSEYGGAE